MRPSIVALLFALTVSQAGIPAQTFGSGSSTATHTVLHNIHLTGDAGAYTEPQNGHSPALVFMTSSLPGGERSVVQANLAAVPGAAQLAIAKSLGGHLTVSVTCPDFGLLTINNAKTGKVKRTGTGEKCTVDSLH